MSGLAREACVACRENSPPVTAAETSALLREIPQWTVIERDGGKGEFAFFDDRRRLALGRIVHSIGFLVRHGAEKLARPVESVQTGLARKHAAVAPGINSTAT